MAVDEDRQFGDIEAIMINAISNALNFEFIVFEVHDFEILTVLTETNFSLEIRILCDQQLFVLKILHRENYFPVGK